MDLRSVDTSNLDDDGVWMTVTHPVTGDDTDMRIKLLSVNSETYRDAENKILGKRYNRPTGTKVDPTDLKAQQAKLYATATLAWENVVLDGKEYPCNANNAYLLYQNSGYSWLRKQVDAFIGTEANFLETIKENLKFGVGGDSVSSPTAPMAKTD